MHEHQRGCREVLDEEESQLPGNILSLLRCPVGTPAFYYGSELAEITGLRRAEEASHSVRRRNADLGLRYLARHDILTSGVVLTATSDWSPAQASWEEVWASVGRIRSVDRARGGELRHALTWIWASRMRRVRAGAVLYGSDEADLAALGAGVIPREARLWEQVEEGAVGQGGVRILEWARAGVRWEGLPEAQYMTLVGLAGSWTGTIPGLEEAATACLVVE